MYRCSFLRRSRKDSCNNIKTTKEFTVNMISEPFIEAAKWEHRYRASLAC